MNAFWGSRWSKSIAWLLPALGAAAAAAPNIVGWADGSNAPAAYSLGLGLALSGSGYQGIDRWRASKHLDAKQDKYNDAVASLHRTLSVTILESEASTERIKFAIEAVQERTRELLDKPDGRLRVCIYQLEYRDERVPSSFEPGQRPRDSAVFVRNCSPTGRGTDAARQVFAQDAEGKYTIDTILRNEHIWCSDTHNPRKRPPGMVSKRSYRQFLSVPIVVGDEVEGMLTCDAPNKTTLSEGMVRTLRTTGIIAGMLLRSSSIATDPERPVTIQDPFTPTGYGGDQQGG